jgi:hypothetical protein
MSKFTSSADIETREQAIAYLSGKSGSLLDFFSLKWEKRDDQRIFADAGAFTVLHSTEDAWWEVGFKKMGEDDVTVVRFYSMEQCVAYIVCRWW